MLIISSFSNLNLLIIILLNLKIFLINGHNINHNTPQQHSSSSFYSLLPSFSIIPKDLLRSLTNLPSNSFIFNKNNSSNFLTSSETSFSLSSSSSESSSEKDSSCSSKELMDDDLKREKAWKDALKKSRTVDLLLQRKHTGDIVQLWEKEKLKMRNALRSDANNRWTMITDNDGKYVIPYVITGRFTKRQKANITRAMNSIAKNTCVKFRPKRNKEYDYVDIQNEMNEGCYTTVGRQRGRQVLMLESGWQEYCGWGCVLTYPGCTDHPTAIHELMHKVGLWHEQMRYDRDKYIKINLKNIIPGLENQFGKIGRGQSTTYNLPYDYESVMHYKKNAGARDEDLITMETRDKRYTDVIGNAKDASPEDYKKICSIYKCKTCMGRKFKPLKNRRRK